MAVLVEGRGLEWEREEKAFLLNLKNPVNRWGFFHLKQSLIWKVE